LGHPLHLHGAWAHPLGPHGAWAPARMHTWRLGPASVLGTPYAHVALLPASVLGTPLRVRGAWAALGGNHARSPLGDT